MKPDAVDGEFFQQGYLSFGRPNSDTSGDERDLEAITLIHLDQLDVPLALAERVLRAYWNGPDDRYYSMENWEAILAFLAEDLWIRSGRLEKLLAARG